MLILICNQYEITVTYTDFTVLKHMHSQNAVHIRLDFAPSW